MRIDPLGDRALIVELGGGVDAATLERVRTAVMRIDTARIAGVTDVVPGYTSIAVHYDPLVVSAAVTAGARDSSPGARMRDALARALTAGRPPRAETEPATVEIPVRYGGEQGPDLAYVAEAHGMTEAEVVAAHTRPTYVVHLIGFVPGFPYLGGLDPRLATARRATPRTAVPAGSVGIGGEQTGVYPLESPGGWHLIGRTALSLFDPARERPALLRIGDRVRFRAE